MDEARSLLVAALVVSVAAWAVMRFRRQLLETGYQHRERMGFPRSRRQDSSDNVASIIASAFLVLLALILWAGALAALFGMDR